jgi:hypothetical protein
MHKAAFTFRRIASNREESRPRRRHTSPIRTRSDPRTIEFTAGNKTLAAKMLGLALRTLYRCLEGYAGRNWLAAENRNEIARRQWIASLTGNPESDQRRSSAFFGPALTNSVTVMRDRNVVLAPARAEQSRHDATSFRRPLPPSALKRNNSAGSAGPFASETKPVERGDALDDLHSSSQ